MKKKQWIILVAVIVLAAAAVIVGFHVRNTQLAKETKDAITLIVGGAEKRIPIADLDREDFSGEMVNGKGDRFTRTCRGVELSALLAGQGIAVDSVTGVKATSADQYSAQLTGDEIREGGRVYLAVRIDGKAVEGIDAGTAGVQLLVFGDPDSKRAVRYLSVLEIETAP